MIKKLYNSLRMILRVSVISFSIISGLYYYIKKKEINKNVVKKEEIINNEVQITNFKTIIKNKVAEQLKK